MKNELCDKSIINASEKIAESQTNIRNVSHQDKQKLADCPRNHIFTFIFHSATKLEESKEVWRGRNNAYQNSDWTIEWFQITLFKNIRAVMYALTKSSAPLHQINKLLSFLLSFLIRKNQIFIQFKMIFWKIWFLNF